ncbi:hypothetical protein JCM10914A_29330 [Paenibacillus sp. JCM 10914]|uniref:phage baseplate protein n=1 Tax=Paenibacillus sp. JCM 10914 TaxID=1236974 RepID=UPI0003CC9955|nr:hypothetical protein [Paenibacillus sp. JCM 10914]GAE09430.1 teichoic acid biosynthesis protein c [Paenibacillus sp. JCM 10914]
MNTIKSESVRLNDKKFGQWWLRKAGVLVLTATLFGSTLGIAGDANASIPTSQVFDLGTPSTMLIREKQVHNATVLQSIGFDNVNQHIYVAQLVQGGLQLPGESGPVSGSVRSANGDLCITKLDFAGNKLSYMYVKGAGHGVSIGVEPGIGQSGEPVAYLWTETDAENEGAGGRGTKLARFPFTDGAVVTPNTPWLDKFDIVPGAFNTTASVDMEYGHLLMRYRLDGVYYFDVYDLEQVKQNNYVSLAKIQIPSLPSSFQGYTKHGNYVYILEGNSYGSPGSVYPDGNTYITSLDLTTGETVERKLSRAGYTLPFREPEGMGIQIPDMNHPGGARLAFGFASTVSSTNTSKLVSIYYKDQFKSSNE